MPQLTKSPAPSSVLGYEFLGVSVVGVSEAVGFGQWVLSFGPVLGSGV